MNMFKTDFDGFRTVCDKSIPGIGALFDRHVEVAEKQLLDVTRRLNIRLARVLDKTDDGDRRNKLPCDHR